MKIMPFSKLPPHAVFRVLKEKDRPTTAKGLFVKISNSRSYAFSRAQTAVFALGDMVELVSKHPSQLSPAK